jgi:hypothetical protein
MRLSSGPSLMFWVSANSELVTAIGFAVICGTVVFLAQRYDRLRQRVERLEALEHFE